MRLKSEVIVISDLHIGDGTILDDFDVDERFCELISAKIPAEIGRDTQLVVNGDFFDFVRVRLDNGRSIENHSVGVTEAQSIEKLERIVAAHPRILESLRGYLAAGGELIVVPGNHDVDLCWPSVFDRLKEHIGAHFSRAVLFESAGEIHQRRVHIEHGHQWSYENSFEHWPNPIVAAGDQLRLERPWGTMFLDCIFNELQAACPLANSVRPHWKLAFIIVKHFGASASIPPELIAKFLVFFVQHGGRFAGEQLLGSHDDGDSAEVEALIQWCLPEAGKTYREHIIRACLDERNREFDAPGGKTESLPFDEGLPGLLGRTVESGMGNRELSLFASGDTEVVVFGHTHAPADGTDSTPRRRAFNTGSWCPSILIRDDDWPSWPELQQRKPQRDIRYLVIHIEPRSARGSLKRLPTDS